ncbi:23 kDa integral membrane protein-like [Aricia agestis]|uniref:23 kDa integral membrane protein-like n=1 Tax=Aricia agestis TaxID=91739 RepID=UPI001C207FEE|nr:23 kDa integral membrane protein-like [Aricia agestis]
MRWNCAVISASCAKTLLIILNGCCILLALSTFVFAVVDTRILKQYGRENASGTFTGDVIIIIACLLLIAVVTMGTVGAFKEHVKMLYLYIGFLMLMVALEVLISIYVSVQRYGLQFRVSEWLRQDFFGNGTELNQGMWDELQLTYECCGLNGPDDYLAIRQPIPLSCCPRAYRARTAYAQEILYNTCIRSKSYYMTGCEDQLLGLQQSDADWLVGVAVTAFWFEAIQMLLAMHVANRAKNNVQVYKATVRY